MNYKNLLLCIFSFLSLSFCANGMDNELHNLTKAVEFLNNPQSLELSIKVYKRKRIKAINRIHSAKSFFADRLNWPALKRVNSNEIANYIPAIQELVRCKKIEDFSDCD